MYFIRLYFLFFLLHVSEQKHVICIHHKTGTMLAASVFRRACAMASFNSCDPSYPEKGKLSCCPYTFDVACTGKHKAEMVVHFLRNPVNEIISAYHFHKVAFEVLSFESNIDCSGG
eukprot:m.198809 g.198809  ORF g.198809 m.198809 type:complete len:116 (+) comp15720_c1_seq4:68-415(+)